MNIIYRVYEKGEINEWGVRNDIILNQEVCMCNSRDHFKEIVRSLYGPNIAFKNSKNLLAGEPYVIIISEDCYDAEKYISVMNYTCTQCGKEFTALQKSLIKLGSYNLSVLSRLCPELYQKRASELENMVFCCPTCREKKFSEIREEFAKYSDENDLIPETYITQETFLSEFSSGYIYKITKKSTGEFYVGQTKYNPIFRWGQHLTTCRFDVKHMDDYMFEVLEIVKNDPTVLRVREAYWIERERAKCPEKSLNIQNPDEEKWEDKLKEDVDN